MLPPKLALLLVAIDNAAHAGTARTYIDALARDTKLSYTFVKRASRQLLADGILTKAHTPTRKLLSLTAKGQRVASALQAMQAAIRLPASYQAMPDLPVPGVPRRRGRPPKTPPSDTGPGDWARLVHDEVTRIQNEPGREARP